MQLNVHISAAHERQRGFTLVELMVALAIGGLILAALAAAFYTSSTTRKEGERTARQTENGSYAMQLLADDLRLAGFYGEFNPNVLSLGASSPNPCKTAVSDLVSGLPLQVQGYDNGAGMPTECTTLLTDRATGTDVVVVRRTSTCIAGATGCDAVSGGTPYFQASLCGTSTELASTNPADYYALDTNTANLTRHTRHLDSSGSCDIVAPLRRYLTHVYYIANNDNPGDGIPTLKRAELDTDGASTPGTVFKIEPLVEGIQNLQLEYGIDDAATSGTCGGDGTPEAFTADPSSYTSTCTTTAGFATWRNVVAARINILARNADGSPGYVDSKIYRLGLKADGTDNCFPACTGSGYGDNIKRRVYDALVRMNNPADRRLVP
jgi:type IV pilus assembly protein PilW